MLTKTKCAAIGYSLQFVRPSVGKKVAAACLPLVAKYTRLVRWCGRSLLRGKISGMMLARCHKIGCTKPCTPYKETWKEGFILYVKIK